MDIPVGVSWVLLAAFLALSLPPLVRLMRFDHGASPFATRNADLAEMLLAVAMAAMVSPIGGPIPAAGWETVLGGTAVWFAFAWFRALANQGWRGQGLVDHRHHGHHAISAIAMFLMIFAMPHANGGHGPWFTMSTMDSPVVREGEYSGVFLFFVVILVGYFMIDAAKSAVILIRGHQTRRKSHQSRFACRGLMGLGMTYMFISIVVVALP